MTRRLFLGVSSSFQEGLLLFLRLWKLLNCKDKTDPTKTSKGKVICSNGLKLLFNAEVLVTGFQAGQAPYRTKPTASKKEERRRVEDCSYWKSNSWERTRL